MNLRRKTMLGVVLALVIVFSMSAVALAGNGFAGGGKGGAGSSACPARPNAATAAPRGATGTTKAMLSSADAEAVLFMLEEEKMARDVYQALYEKWGVATFSTIAASESRHLASIQRLVERYNLELPATFQTAGRFDNAKLQNMYTTLVAQGQASLNAAYKVGVTIETEDIKDLQAFIDAGGRRDIMRVFQRLVIGSGHHLKAFERLVSNS